MFTTMDIIGLLVTLVVAVGYFGFHLKYRPIKDRLNELLVFVLFLVGMSIVFWYLYILRYYNHRLADLIAWLIYGPTMGFLVLIFIETGIVSLFGKLSILNSRRETLMDRVCNSPKKRSPLAFDFLRKIMHIIYFCVILGVCLFTAYMTKITSYDRSYYLSYFWGADPQGELIFLSILTNPARYEEIGILHPVVFLIFYLGTQIAIILDWIRFSNRFWTIGRNTLLHFARKCELEGIPSFIPIFIGVLPASLLFPPLPVLGIMVAVIFGDLAASQVGIRIGRHKLAWNQGKSWEGLIAGSLISVLSSLFVGPIWGIIIAFGYLVGDAITEKPIKIMDNLLTPLILCILLLSLSLLGLPYIIPAWL